jgi:hypothetical protein
VAIRRRGAPRAGRRALQALTAAALALPGLAASPARAADGEDFSVQYSHYSEGERDLTGRSYSTLNIRPLKVDSFAANAGFPLGDRFRLGVEFSQDTWSGATPVVSLPNAAIAQQLMSGASSPTLYYTDVLGVPVVVDFNNCSPVTGYCAYKRDPRLVHLMGSASPETRRQGRLSLTYDWDRASVNVAGGLSNEPDFQSRFVSVGGEVNFDHKLTTLSWDASFTDDRIEANLSANTAADWTQYQNQIGEKHGEPTLFGRRRDLAFSLNATRVINRDAFVEAGIVVARDSGLLMDPYKAVIFAFDDPNQFIFDPNLRFVQIRGVLEQRPHQRDQLSLNLRYVQYVRRLDGALHLDYRLFTDSWGIKAHTFEGTWRQPIGAGFTLTPSVRYYTQTAARFYRPFFLFDQPFPGHLGGGPLDWSQIKALDFSSDARLSAFGALSGGLTLEKQLREGLKAEIGYEYYTHRGDLKLGGGGEGSFADFDSSTVHAGLTLDLSLARGGSPSPGGGAEPSESRADRGAPAGVEFANSLGRAGAFAIDMRYQGAASDGPLMFAGKAVDDQTILNQACGPVTCAYTPTRLRSRELSADFLYAPLDFLTVVVSPTIVDNQVVLRQLQFFILPAIGPHLGPNLAGMHASGGLGDTNAAVLLDVFNRPGAHLTAGIGFSAPTGGPGVRLNAASDYAGYPMQLGSGAWDFTPSVTYEGAWDRLRWGAQLAGVKRLQHANIAGYRLGDCAQATAWAGVQIFDWLSATGRGLYSHTGAITGPTDGAWPHTVNSPIDVPSNFGGRTVDMGLGMTAVVPAGALKGDFVSVEWLQPVADQLRGYQLARTGALNVRVGVDF